MTEKEMNKQKIQDKSKALRLLEDKDFFDLFLVKYLKESTYEMIYREGPSDGVIKEINARKSFNDFLYGIIDEGTIAEEGR